MNRTNISLKYSLLIGIVTLSCLSCGKGKSRGTFFVRGQFQEQTGAPKQNLDVYVKFEEPGSLGLPAIRERVGVGITDSTGNFKFECTVYAGGTYTIEPASHNITPLIGDTVDIGIIKW